MVPATIVIVRPMGMTLFEAMSAVLMILAMAMAPVVAAVMAMTVMIPAVVTVMATLVVPAMVPVVATITMIPVASVNTWYEQDCRDDCDDC